MQVRAEQLGNLLRRELAPVYLLHGDEPLQLTEAADAIRRACREQQIEERQVFSVMPGFDWRRLAAEVETQSLFASRRLIDLRVPEGKVGSEGSKFLLGFGERPADNVILLIVLENPPAAVRKSRLFSRLEAMGVAIWARPLAGAELINWLARRASDRGVLLEREALQFLAQQTEGNLLAAAQEIDKLLLLYEKGSVSTDTVIETVADHARFDVFGLVDSVLAGRVAHSDRILAGLAGEGVASPVILWALTRELRVLLQFSVAREQGLPMAEISRKLKLWERRRELLAKALQRLDRGLLHLAISMATQIDRAIKGQRPGNPFPMLRSLCLGLASGNPKLINNELVF